MRTTTMTLLLTLVPTILAAQAASSEPDPMQGFSADGRVQAEATLQAALDQGLPVQPLYAVMLEGQAKGAGETRILGAEQQTLARLALAQQAIVSAGRPQPSDAEVTRGASLIAQGMTSAELGAVVGQVPPQQSLMVALDGLAAGTAAVAGAGADATAGIGSGATAAASASTAVGADLGAGGAVGSLSATGGAAVAVSGGLVRN